jgi:predicted nucleic acid-binding protein
MSAVFVDTSYDVALLSQRDVGLPASVGFATTYEGQYFTTEFVLLEVAAFFAKPAGRELFVNLVTLLRSNPRITIRPATSDLFDRGLSLFAARPDKDWSLTDCISFVVMTENGLTDALTADRHIEQARCRTLLA